jgi:hypothetical protein
MLEWIRLPGASFKEGRYILLHSFEVGGTAGKRGHRLYSSGAIADPLLVSCEMICGGADHKSDVPGHSV